MLLYFTKTVNFQLLRQTFLGKTENVGKITKKNRAKIKTTLESSKPAAVSIAKVPGGQGIDTRWDLRLTLALCGVGFDTIHAQGGPRTSFPLRESMYEGLDEIL